MQPVLASASLGQPLDSPKASFGLPHGYLRTKGGDYSGYCMNYTNSIGTKESSNP